MAWKSVGLGVRGKLRTAISLTSRGKFSPGDGCTILDVDFNEHARSLDLTSWRKVWNRLADVWDKPATRGHVTAAHKGWDRLHYVLSSQIDESSRLHVMDAMTYLRPSPNCMPLQLYFASAEDMATIAASSSDSTPESILGLDDGVICCLRLTPCSYELPENIRDIFLLQDFLNSPNIELTNDGDYTVFAEILPGKKGEIVFGDGTTLNRYMWATIYTEKMNKELVERFGPDVGYETVRADEYDTFMDIYFLKLLQLTGVTNPGIELGLTIAQDWPYARLDCKVLSITGTTKMEVEPFPYSSVTDGMVYEIENDNELPFQTLQNGVWTDIKLGDIIDAGTPVTAAVRSYDLKNYPNLAKNFPINSLERFHKTVIAYNSQIALLDDVWGYDTYVGAAPGFTVGDVVRGLTSGAWGYVTQSMHGGTAGRVELRRVVGTFTLFETVRDDHGNSARLIALGEPYYDIDRTAHDAYLTRNKRTGSDFTTAVWISFAPSLFFETTYGNLRLFRPHGHIESDAMKLFSPSLLFEGTALAAMHLPDGRIETDYSRRLALEPEGRIETDYGMMLVTPMHSGAQTTLGGWLDYRLSGVHSDPDLRPGEVVTVVATGASGVVTENQTNGAIGAVKIRNVIGTFAAGDILTGETAGDVQLTGMLRMEDSGCGP